MAQIRNVKLFPWLIGWLCLVWAVAAPGCVLAQTYLPKKAQADVLLVEIKASLAQHDAAGALSGILRYRLLGVETPPALIFKEGQLAEITGDHTRAERALAYYLKGAGESDADYREAVTLYATANKAARAQLAKSPLAADHANSVLRSVSDQDWSAETGANLTKRVLDFVSVDDLKRAAARENPRALVILASAYWHGLGGLAEDHVRARKLVQQAVRLGDPRAQSSLGELYRDGEGGLSKDEATATQWFRRAASAGNAIAQNHLAGAYIRGEAGLSVNYTESARLFKLSGDQGYPYAYSQLAWHYATGNGVEKNEREAARLFLMGAERGDSFAQVNLGVYFRDGLGGLRKDYIAAVRWLRASADQGDADGQGGLGDMYANGWGVRKDDAEANRLYKLAADQGDEWARDRLKSRLGQK